MTRMYTFPTVKRKDEQPYREHQTKRVILETYDATQRAMETRVPYQTLPGPPPAVIRGWRIRQSNLSILAVPDC